MYNQITLLYRGNKHNIVNQLYFYEINFKKIKAIMYILSTLVGSDCAWVNGFVYLYSKQSRQEELSESVWDDFRASQVLSHCSCDFC